MTEKLYYEDFFKCSTQASITEFHSKGIIFDRTIAYPEGGGQVGDTGEIFNLRTNELVLFENTTKVGGRTIFYNDFPTINVETKIIHHVDQLESSNFKVGDSCIIRINRKRRILTTTNHSALHLLLVILEEEYPGISKRIFGAKINEKYGRLDFRLDFRFNAENINKIKDKILKKINLNLDIISYSHPYEKEAFYWKCDDQIIPCGGTHLRNTSQIDKIKVKRKNIGKNTERIIIEAIPIEGLLNCNTAKEGKNDTKK